jgi:hypothetical protein
VSLDKETRAALEALPRLAALVKNLGTRVAALEASNVELRRQQVSILTELRARGLKLPEPEKTRHIALSKEARQLRRQEQAAHARKFSKGRPRKKAR